MRSRKRNVAWTFLFLLLFFACSLAGCAKEPEIKNPNTITLGSLADAKRLLPMLASDSASGQISGFVHNGLTKYDKDIRVQGDLAESWDISPDGLTITFHLRKGVKWHDGQPFTADDVVFTYETVINPKTPTPYGSNYGPVKSVKALDAHTVRVTYSEPFAPALESWRMGVIPKHLLDGKNIGKSELNRAPVGTGPYRLKEWITGQKVLLVAFDDYFEGRPNIDRIVIRVIPDTATTFLELKFGGIDMTSVTPPQFKLQIPTDFFSRYFTTYQYPSFGFTYLGYNLKHPVFRNLKVRQAIAHAINKEEIIAGVLLGLGSPCTGPFPQQSWAFNPNVRDYAYDPAKTVTLLGELGWKKNAQGILEKDGKPFSFTVITNQGNEARLKTAQILKEQFRRVGIDMNIKVLEWQAMLNEFIDKRRFEVILMGWGLGQDPDLYDIWHSSKTKEKEFNFISYKNDEVDRLLIEGRQTFSIEKRKKIYHRIHEILAAEQPYAFLYVPNALPVLHKRFKGVEKAPLGIWHDFIHWQVPKNKVEWYQ